MHIHPLKIGSLKTSHNLLLAPLAGITNYAFRQMCRRFGADLTFTEMVSADGLCHGNRATRELLETGPEDHPIGFQLFGNNADTFSRALPVMLAYQPDVVDINFGCPVRKVVRRGAGAALLNDIAKLEQLVAVVKSAGLPTTAKIRIGWDWQSIVAVEAAQAVEAGGADAVVVHARTRSQGYGGQARWEYIARVKEAVHIPVIGNGDVFSPEAAKEMFRQTGADGIMLARGTLGKPWLFRDILHYLKTGELLEPPGMTERLQLIEQHYGLETDSLEEQMALPRLKKHFVWYTRGLPHTSRLRDRIFRANSFEEVHRILTDYQQRAPVTV